MIPVSALEATFDIVEYLAKAGAAPAKEIAREVDRPKSTVYDHLESLQALNYVIKSGTSYRLTSQFLYVGMRARDNLRVFDVAKSEIDELAEETDEHAALFIQENDLAVMLYKQEGSNTIQITQYDGMAFPPHCGAAGKVMLAYLPDHRVSEIIDTTGLPAYTESTITDEEVLFDELEQIRERGCAFERSEHLKGVRAVAVPLLDDKDGTVGAVTIYGPASRFQGDYFKETLPARLSESANVIEVNYSY